MKLAFLIIALLTALVVSSQNVVNIAGSNPYTQLRSLGGLRVDSGLSLTPTFNLNSSTYNTEGTLRYYFPTRSMWYKSGTGNLEIVNMPASYSTITTLPGIGQTVNNASDFINLFFGTGTGTSGGGSSSLLYVSSMAALRSTTGVLNSMIYVQGFYTAGDGGGGNFQLTNTSNTDTVSGMRILAGTSGMVWVRMYEGGKFNYKWFGAVGDSITYNNYLQTAMDYVSTRYPGGTLYIPNGKYRDTSHALLRSNMTLEGETEYGAVIFNDLKIQTGGRFQYQNPIRQGNLTPGDWDSSTLNYRPFDSVTYTGNAMVIHNMPIVFTIGRICVVRGTTFFTQKSGVNKFIFTRVVEITKKVGDTIFFGHPLDSVLVKGYIGAIGDWIPQSNRDPWLLFKNFVVRTTISNLTLKSMYGQIVNGTAKYECNMLNVHTYGQEMPFGNGEVWCKYDNIHAEFAKKVMEAAVGSHDDILTNIHANFFIMDSVIIRPAQPLIKFSECVHNIKIIGLTVDAGNFAGKGICFYAATRCGVDNFLIIARNLKSNLVQFSTSVSTLNDDSTEVGAPTTVDHNYLTNGAVVGNYTSKTFQLINFQRYVNGGELYANVLANVRFFGQPQKQAMNLDGRDESLNNVWCENGNITYGDSSVSSTISNSYFGDADTAVAGNIKFINVSNRYGVMNKAMMYSYTGQKQAAQPPMTMWADTSQGIDRLYYKQSNGLTQDLLRMGGGGGTGGGASPTTPERFYLQSNISNWVGTTQPSGTYLGVYRIDTLNSNTVTVAFFIKYSASGTSITGVDMALPIDIPIPAEPSPFNAIGDIMYVGNANLAGTGGLSGTGKFGLIKTGINTYKFQVIAASSVARTLQANITYNY